MLHKAMMTVAALAAMAVAAAVGVIALAFALYAFLKPLLGPSGAAASVAAVCALVFLIVGLVAALQGAERREEPEDVGVAEKLLELIRDKPMASAGVAAAAGLLLVRNPTIIGVVLRTLLETWPALSGGLGGKGPRRKY